MASTRKAPTRGAVKTKATQKASATKSSVSKKSATKKTSSKKSAAKKAAAKAAPQKQAATARKKKPAPTAEVDADVLEFIDAIDKYKKKHARPFPSWSEVLQVVLSLGYTK